MLTRRASAEWRSASIGEVEPGAAAVGLRPHARQIALDFEVFNRLRRRASRRAMERGEGGRRSREAVGPSEVSEHGPLGRRQPLHKSFAGRNAPEAEDQFRDDATMHFQLLDHAKIVAFRNYLNKSIDRSPEPQSPRS